MTRSEIWLARLLRIFGAAGVTALFAAVMPASWMTATHEWLGLGAMPADPIVIYLARSTSLFYAIFGGLAILVSLDLRRHRAVVSYLAVCTIAVGAILGVADHLCGLPPWWSVSEGVSTVAMGVVLLALQRAAGGPSDDLAA